MDQDNFARGLFNELQASGITIHMLIIYFKRYETATRTQNE